MSRMEHMIVRVGGLDSSGMVRVLVLRHGVVCVNWRRGGRRRVVRARQHAHRGQALKGQRQQHQPDDQRLQYAFHAGILAWRIGPRRLKKFVVGQSTRW